MLHGDNYNQQNMLMKTNIESVALPRGLARKREIKVAPWKYETIDILIRTQAVELTEKQQAAIIRKISRARRYAPRALRVRVQLQKVHPYRSAHQFRAQVHYEIPGNDLFAEHSAAEPVAAINRVIEKIRGQLRRRKTAQLARRVRELRAQAHSLTRQI